MRQKCEYMEVYFKKNKFLIFKGLGETLLQSQTFSVAYLPIFIGLRMLAQYTSQIIIEKNLKTDFST